MLNCDGKTNEAKTDSDCTTELLLPATVIPVMLLPAQRNWTMKDGFMANKFRQSSLVVNK